MTTNNSHSEEFSDIAQRIPSSYSTIIVYGLLVLIICAITLAWTTEVPEILLSEVRVTSANPPIILKAQSSGKIHLIKEANLRHCHKGEYIAVIENSANYNDIQWLKDQMETIIIDSIDEDNEIFSKKMLLGDLGLAYYTFKRSFWDSKRLLDPNNRYSLSLRSLKEQYTANLSSKNDKQRLLGLYKNEERIKQSRFESDSTLLEKGAITLTDFDQTQVAYLEGKSKVLALQTEIDQIARNSEQTLIKIRQTQKEFEIEASNAQNALYDAYNQLFIQLRNWEKSYAIVSPGDCSIEYADMIVEGAFVTIGDPLYNVIYDRTDYYGVMILPSDGAGTVHIGDSVNLKMNPYPFQEYGSLRGYVKSISKNSINRDYLVHVDLPFGLVSTNGFELVFAETMYGQAEIITEKKRFLFKLINQLKYLTQRRMVVAAESERDEKIQNIKF